MATVLNLASKFNDLDDFMQEEPGRTRRPKQTKERKTSLKVTLKARSTRRHWPPLLAWESYKREPQLYEGPRRKKYKNYAIEKQGS